LHLHELVTLNGLQCMPALQEFKCSWNVDSAGTDFDIFISRLPSLTRLELGMPSLFKHWGSALVSSCPHLTSLLLRSPYSDVFSSDIGALHSLPLTTLSLCARLDLSALQAIGHMSTLRSLSLLRCDAVFHMEGAHALCGLSN
jgi:hypothetical protein